MPERPVLPVPRFVPDVPLEQLAISELNPRTTRPEKQIAALADLIRTHGFDPTCAPKAIQVNGGYQIFAGGTRLLAAQQAECSQVPLYLYEGLSRPDIWRLAYWDNEQAGAHNGLGTVDVWLDYAKRQKAEGWTQTEMGRFLGVSQQLVSLRLRLAAAPWLHQFVLDASLEENHCLEILNVYTTSSSLSPWLTPEEAQTELVEEILDKHRGKSSDDPGVKKPTVKKVRAAAARWKKLFQSAEKRLGELDKSRWQKLFVRILARDKARTVPAVEKAYNETLESKRLYEEERARRAHEEGDAADREAARLTAEQMKLARLQELTAKVRHGDAREHLACSPLGFHLLLTDPPYGMSYQSNRRVISGKKEALAHDSQEEALALLRDVLAVAFPRMAEDSTLLVFTGWRHEPAFREVVTAAGFSIKGSLIWAKPNHGTGDLEHAFAPKHERILHAVKGNPTLRHRYPDVLEGDVAQDSEHPTQKPADLLAKLIEATTDTGQVVVDPFAGSGSTVLEAQRLQRDFFAIELEEQWHRRIVDAVHTFARQEESAQEAHHGS